MPTEINTKKVDLYSTNIKTPEDEQFATNELVSQILGWLKRNEKPVSKGNTLIMNKLVYFSMKEIQKINNLFIITNGWYKYGPCYEQLREKDAPETMEDYRQFNPRDEYLNEVELICEREFPIFEKSSNANASTTIKEQYYYTYLKHVYSDLVPPELKWLQPFFQSKHELEHLMYCFAFDKVEHDDKSKLQRKFSDNLFQFESAICDVDYDKQVKLGQLQDVTLRFCAILEPIFNDGLLSTCQKDQKFKSFAGGVAMFFDEKILMPFAYKNLIATFESPFKEVETKKRCFRKAADELTDEINQRLPDMIRTLKKYELM